jgi:uncharacterized protein
LRLKSFSKKLNLIFENKEREEMNDIVDSKESGSEGLGKERRQNRKARDFFDYIFNFALRNPKYMFFSPVIVTCLFFSIVLLWTTFNADPQDMMEKTNPIRVNNVIKSEEFFITGGMQIGVEHPKNEYGVWNMKTLKRIHFLEKFVSDDLAYMGIISKNMMSPKNVDAVISYRDLIQIYKKYGIPTPKNFSEDKGVKKISLDRLMSILPETQKGALVIRDIAALNPFFIGTMISFDKEKLSFAISIKNKKESYRIYNSIRKYVDNDYQKSYSLIFDMDIDSAFKYGYDNYISATKKLHDAIGKEESQYVDFQTFYNVINDKPVTMNEDGVIVSDPLPRIALFKNAAELQYDNYRHMNGRIYELFGDIETIPSHEEFLKKLGKIGEENFHIIGLGLAEVEFGASMLMLMPGLCALCMAFIFIILFLHFKSYILALSGLLMPMLTVGITMGLFVLTVGEVHIMTSMIPIFLMPIVIADSIHLFSKFSDAYYKASQTGSVINRHEIIIQTMRSLHLPMFYTSFTTGAGFFTLLTSDIPPFRYFGLFTGIGVVLAYLFTMTVLPALLTILPERWLLSLCSNDCSIENRGDYRVIKFIEVAQLWSFDNYKKVMIGSFIVFFIAALGCTQIVVNDNVMKWFTEDRDIRIADVWFYKYFGGSYPLYVSFQIPENKSSIQPAKIALIKKLKDNNIVLPENFDKAVNEIATKSHHRYDFLYRVWQHSASYGMPDMDFENTASFETSKTSDDDKKWSHIEKFLDKSKIEYEIMKHPQVLRYQAALQKYLLDKGLIHKTHSFADLIKYINRSIHDGEIKWNIVPETYDEVIGLITIFEGGHDGARIEHMITSDGLKLNMLVQMKSGDNQDALSIEKTIDEWMKENPFHFKDDTHGIDVTLERVFFGMSHVNIGWQDVMVDGTMYSTRDAGMYVYSIMLFMYGAISFMVLISILKKMASFQNPFSVIDKRKLIIATISMIPLTITVFSIYGYLGLSQYFEFLPSIAFTMPIAVLASLSIGLSVDGSVFYMQHALRAYGKYKNEDEDKKWRKAIEYTSQEPSRAIYYNVTTLACGFAALLFATLVPYLVVSKMMIAIMLLSGASTFIIMPAAIGWMNNRQL